MNNFKLGKFRVGYALNNMNSIFLLLRCGGSAVGCSGSMWRNVDVLGPQVILRSMRSVLHVHDSLANWHMQANLHDTQGNLHNVFATRVDSQPRLHFFALDFLRSVLRFFALACGFFVNAVGTPAVPADSESH
jgi:hypothetical protein